MNYYDFGIKLHGKKLFLTIHIKANSPEEALKKAQAELTIYDTTNIFD